MRCGSLLAFALWLTASCALPYPPVVPSEDPNFSDPQEVEQPGVSEDPAEPMRILPGDTLRIVNHSVQTSTTDGLVVDELGMVRIPLAGDVLVGGMTLSEASERVQQAMRRFDRVATVDVFLAKTGGHQATVLGAVTRPGRFPVEPGMRLADLVAAAHGILRLTEEGEAVQLGDIGAARLVRGRRTLPVSLDLAMSGDPRHNVRVRAGDHLYVPPNRGDRVIVLGNVGDPLVMVHRRGMRLTEALARAGGVTIDGDRGDVRVIRGDLRAPQIFQASLDDIADGDAPDVMLARGDVIYVATHWIATVGEVIDRLIGDLIATGVTVGIAVGLSQP